MAIDIDALEAVIIFGKVAGADTIKVGVKIESLQAIISELRASRAVVAAARDLRGAFLAREELLRSQGSRMALDEAEARISAATCVLSHIKGPLAALDGDGVQKDGAPVTRGGTT